MAFLQRRANIYIKHSPDSGIYLYTQINGDRLPMILQSALMRGKAKWGDTPAMTRIIFGEMIQKDVLNMDDFAISTEVIDNDHLILVVDDKKRLVGVGTESGEIYKRYSFENYLELPEKTLQWKNIADGYQQGDDLMVNSNKKVRFNL